VTPRCLAERLYGATVALPHPAREALDMRPGATFAAAARRLIVGWKRESTGSGRMSRKEKTDGEREHC
jgi:hypothetical protein